MVSKVIFNFDDPLYPFLRLISFSETCLNLISPWL